MLSKIGDNVQAHLLVEHLGAMLHYPPSAVTDGSHSDTQSPPLIQGPGIISPRALPFY